VGSHVQPDLIVFDCDGVLVDSEILAVEIESELLTDAGFPVTAEEIAATCVGLSYTSMMVVLGERFGRPLPDRLITEVQGRVIDAFPARLQPVDGMSSALGDMALPRCIASSSDIDRIQLSIELTGLDVHFEPDRVFSAQMVDRGKPAPDLFLHAASICGTDPSRCLVVEDSPHGVEAAVAAGMDVIGFVGGGHATPTLAGRLRYAGANRVASHASELAGLV
jgi:HAD superfamily hydrolase (TIGR01509 family)